MELHHLATNAKAELTNLFLDESFGSQSAGLRYRANHTGSPITQSGQSRQRKWMQPVTQLCAQWQTVLSTLLADASLK